MLPSHVGPTPEPPTNVIYDEQVDSRKSQAPRTTRLLSSKVLLMCNHGCDELEPTLIAYMLDVPHVLFQISPHPGSSAPRLLLWSASSSILVGKFPTLRMLLWITHVEDRDWVRGEEFLGFIQVET